MSAATCTTRRRFRPILGPLARAYYFRTAHLSEAEREERAQLFGRLADGLRPVGAYSWKLPNGRTLLEIPVTTLPVIKVPFHFSYLMYLSRFSERLMVAYLGAALLACRACRHSSRVSCSIRST